ncbi:riboflavin kinase [Kineococcus rhizosphaerae]|uniref:riboflavin kinase n=1 Tax=Kineococcus rhizosphaerae TaxID=559628 RepID=A0A2T0QXZ9_9ACTN|nr:riboflavin kinase [Kineococcus rhizosphaerae]PRY11067.1 riboflavin kinase [Kineococcus rhizosphaerae]
MTLRVPGPRPRTDLPTVLVRGVVEHGDARGRALGFPTANLPIVGTGPADGVWAGTVQVDPDQDGPVHVAAVSVGRRPTYYADGVRLLEAFLLDVTLDLYDHEVLVTLHRHLRPQLAFSGSDELVEQMHRDVAATREWAAATVR